MLPIWIGVKDFLFDEELTRKEGLQKVINVGNQDCLLFQSTFLI